MKIIIFIVVMYPFVLNAQKDVLIRISSEEQLELYDPFVTGYVNVYGDTIIPIGKYYYCVTDTFDIIAIVLLKDRSGFYAINRKEEVLFKVKTYDNGPDYVKDGLFRIEKSGKIGYANMQGEIVIKPQFEWAFPFSEGLAQICVGGIVVKEYEHFRRVGGKWGYINKQGKIVIPLQYDMAYTFTNGKAKVIKDGNEFYIDKSGKRLSDE